MNVVDLDAPRARSAVDDGGWPLAVALAIIGPLAVVLGVAMIAFALG